MSTDKDRAQGFCGLQEKYQASGGFADPPTYSLVGTFPTLPAMTEAAIEQVRRFEDHQLATQPQFDLEMEHVIHAGMYARTCLVPAGVIITGARIKIPTILVIRGDCCVWLGGAMQRITGHAVIPASAGRKQVFRALTDTHITMLFPTQARTVPDAEREFTDEAHRLAPGRARTIVTGDPS